MMATASATLRRVLFTLYGTAIGLAYVAILAITWPLSLLATAILSIIVVAIFGYYGNHLPKVTEVSDWQIVAAMPLMPFAMLGGMIAFGFVVVVMAVLWPYAAIGAAVAERRFRTVMKSRGRFATLDELRPRLIAGEGTLIADTLPKGPYRLWWTQDDLFALGSPASTREDLISIHEGKGHPFNDRCLEEYLNENTGKAWLTSIPPRYAAPAELSRRFPRMKVAKVFRSFVVQRREPADG